MECSVCGHEGADVHKSGEGAFLESIRLCSFCGATLTGITAIYPQNCDAQAKWTAVLVAQLYWQLKADLDKRSR